MIRLLIILLFIATNSFGQAQQVPAQTQRFMSTLNAVGYAPTLPNFRDAYYLGMHLYGNVTHEGQVYVETDTLLFYYFPYIGNTSAALRVDFITLASGSFVGGVTIGTDAWNGNGSSGYFNTTITPPSNIGSYHLGVYSFTNEAANTKVDIGNSTGNSIAHRFLIKTTLVANPCFMLALSMSASVPTSALQNAPASTIGLFIAARLASNTSLVQGFKDGVALQAASNNAPTTGTIGVSWVGHDQSATFGYSTKSYGVAFAGKALTTPQILSLSQAGTYKVTK